MNATLFMLTSAWMAGADVAPAAPATGAPAVVSVGSSCGGAGCAPACDTGCGRVRLLDRIGGLFHRRRCNDACAPACPPPCAPAPVCCTPVPVCKPVCPPPPVCCKPAPVCAPTCAPACAPSCDTGCRRVGLWSRIKGHFARNCCDACPPEPCCGPAAVGGHPEVIPAPKDTKPKGGVTSLQVEPIVTPVFAPRAPIEIGGPANPF